MVVVEVVDVLEERKILSSSSASQPVGLAFPSVSLAAATFKFGEVQKRCRVSQEAGPNEWDEVMG